VNRPFDAARQCYGGVKIHPRAADTFAGVEFRLDSSRSTAEMEPVLACSVQPNRNHE